MNALFFFEQMLILVLLMAVGFAIRRLKVIDESANAIITQLLLKVTVPATLVSSIAGHQLDIARREVPLLLLVIMLSFAVVGVIAWLAPIAMRVEREQRGAYADMVLFGNVNFMGLPLIVAFIGAGILGPEAMLHAILYNIVFNLSIFSLGMKLIGGRRAKLDLKLFFSPVMLGGMLALLIFMLELPLPYVVSRPVDFLGAATTPLAMVLLGSILGGMRLKEMLRGWRVYTVTALRLVVAPVAVFFALLPLPVDPTLLQVIVIMNAAPMAISVAMFSINYGVHKEMIGKGTFISTLLSVLTMPLLLSILM